MTTITMEPGNVFFTKNGRGTIHKGAGPRMVCMTRNDGVIEVYYESKWTDSTSLPAGVGLDFNANGMGCRFPNGVNSDGLLEWAGDMRFDAFDAIDQHKKALGDVAAHAADLKALTVEAPAVGDPRVAVLDARWHSLEATYGPNAIVALELATRGGDVLCDRCHDVRDGVGR